MIVALATLTYAIIEGPRNGWLSAADAGPVRRLAGAPSRRSCRYELRRERAADRGPLLPQRAVLGRQRDRRAARSPALGGFLFLNTLYLQDVRGLSPLDAGLYMLPMAVGDAGLRAAVRAAGRQPRHPAAAGRRQPRADRQRADPHPADRRRRPFALLIVAYAAVRARLRAASTRRSPTPPSRACPRRRPASPPRSPRPAARSARRSASRCSARSPPAAPRPRSARRSRPPPTSSWWIMVGLGVVVLMPRRR